MAGFVLDSLVSLPTCIWAMSLEAATVLDRRLMIGALGAGNRYP